MAAVSVKRSTALTSFPGRKREDSGNKIADADISSWATCGDSYLWTLSIVRQKNTKETQSPRLVCFLQLVPKLRGVKLKVEKVFFR